MAASLDLSERSGGSGSVSLSLSDSFANLLNSDHTIDNKSPRTTLSCLNSSQYSIESTSSYSPGDLRRREALSPRPSGNLPFRRPPLDAGLGSATGESTRPVMNTNNLTFERPPLDTRVENVSGDPIRYVVSTKNYDGCRPTDGVQSEEVLAIMDQADQALQSKFEDGAHLKVVDMPFRDGVYAGEVDRKSRPHGRGSYVSKNGKKTGWWYKGSFIPIPSEYISRQVNGMNNSATEGKSPSYTRQTHQFTPNSRSDHHEIENECKENPLNGDSVTCASTNTPTSASSEISKHNSLHTQTIMKKAPSVLPAYPRPIAARPKPPPPPPPRQPSNALKHYPPPPRSKSIESRHLAMRLANSNITLPLNTSDVSSSKSHKIPGPPPKMAKRSQPQVYPPPPPPRRPTTISITSSSSADVHNNMSQSRARVQENASILSTSATSNTPDQQEPSLVKLREHLIHGKGVTAPADASSNSQTLKSSQQNQQQVEFLRLRRDYKIGETARSNSHMVPDMTPEKATEAVNSLMNHDFAFVKSPSGRFVYALLAFRTDEVHDNSNQLPLEGSMTFVIDVTGFTINIEKSQWSEKVRLLSSHDGLKKDQTLPVIHNKAQHAHESDNRTSEQNAKFNDQAKGNCSRERKEPKLVQQNLQQIKSGLRIDYKLGETARSESHMIIESDPKKATEAVSSLSTHDFVFVKNSDGLFTYAILAFRSNEGCSNLNGTSEECMTFVLNESACTTTIKRSQWSENVRLASPDYGSEEVPSPPKVDQKVNDCSGEDYMNKLRSVSWLGLPPSTISCDSMEDDLVSCISMPCEFSNEYRQPKFKPSHAMILE